MSSPFLFATYPIVALGAGIVGFAARCVLSGRRLDSLQAERARAKSVLAGGKVWRIGLAMVALIHLVEFVVPKGILEWNGVPWRLYALEGGGLVFGALAIGGSIDVVRRHITHPSTSLRTAVADAVCLSLLVATLVSGWVMQTLYRWGSSWGAAVLTPYVFSVLRGSPITTLVSQMPFLVRLHVVTSFAVVGVFPLTSFALLPMAFLRTAARRAAAAMPRIEPVVNAVKWRVSSWLWQDEDTDPGFQLPEASIVHQSGIVPSPDRYGSDRISSGANAGHDAVRTAR